MNTQTEIWTSLFWIIILIETRAAVIRAECLALYKYQQELFLRVKRVTETAELISWTPDDETRSSGLQIRSRHQRGNHRQTRWLNESSVYYTLLKGQTHHLMSHLSRYRFLLLLLTQSHMTRLFHRLERYIEITLTCNLKSQYIFQATEFPWREIKFMFYCILTVLINVEKGDYDVYRLYWQIHGCSERDSPSISWAYLALF